MSDKKAEIINKIVPILRQYPVRKASFFGSYARGDFTEKSDVDVIVDFFVDKAGLIFSSLRADLAEVLPVYLDLVYRPGLTCMEQSFQKNVEREEVVFCETDVGT